jgi:hypothetical protein
MAAFGDFVLVCVFCNRLRNLVGFSFKITAAAGGLRAHKILCWFVLVGWAIYPLGYMMGTTGWYSIVPAGNIDVAYNIADAINKWFGLVIYSLC